MKKIDRLGCWEVDIMAKEEVSGYQEGKQQQENLNKNK